MEHHALFVILKNCKILNCRLLQIIDGALRVNIKDEKKTLEEKNNKT